MLHSSVLHISDFLDTDTLTKVRGELSRVTGAPATVLSGDAAGMVQQSVRRTTRIPTPAHVRDLLTGRFLNLKPELERHFKLALGDCEEPQFLRY